MPRIITFRLFRLWWAATLNDREEVGKPRLGFTAERAASRAAFYAGRKS